MATINYPESPKEILDRQRTDVQNALSDSDPFLRASFLLALLIGNAGRFWDIYNTIANLQNQLFPWSANDDFLRRWGLFKGRDIKAPSPAEGLISVEGTEGVLIPEGTIYQTTAGNEYEVIDNDYLISEQILSVASITRVGSVATVTTDADTHHYTDNMTITIAGADQSEYNITTIINVTGLNTFEFEVSGTPVTPATGTITSTATFASVPIRSYDSVEDAPATGLDKNIAEGGKVTVQSTIAGADDDAYVQYSEISGGTGEESNTEYRNEVNRIYANPVAHFNVAELKQTTLAIPGVTRAFVKEITPEVGAATVQFMRDDDDDPIPDASERTQVKNELLKIKPAHMDADDLVVPALTKKEITFNFGSLTDDTQSMRNAIEQNLETFFKTVPEPGITIDELTYKAEISQTVDPATGNIVGGGFALNSPIGAIATTTNEIATLKIPVVWSV